jgi:hypothetical protein
LALGPSSANVCGGSSFSLMHPWSLQVQMARSVARAQLETGGRGCERRLRDRDGLTAIGEHVSAQRNAFAAMAKTDEGRARLELQCAASLKAIQSTCK